MNNFKSFAIIGSGGWGTAIAAHIARIYDSVKLYSRSTNTVDEINNYHTNSQYLGATKLPVNIVATNDIQEVAGQEAIFIVVPSTGFDNILNQLKKYNISPNTVFVIATKGISSNPVQLFSEKFKAEFKNDFAFFSGPNFAKEVASQKFAAATISSTNIDLANRLANSLATPNFEMNITDDIITIQIAAIVKNIVAIKSGILEASEAGENARAWLVTKGLKEISQISQAMGGKVETLMQPAVIGDLILTCYSKTSRNTNFGYQLHQNNYSKEFISSYNELIEGVEATKLIKSLISGYDISLEELPIITSVIKAINGL
jgi:glycerol-3-phosphate dehydrogenase (NAD(P)+)